MLPLRLNCYYTSTQVPLKAFSTCRSECASTRVSLPPAGHFQRKMCPVPCFSSVFPPCVVGREAPFAASFLLSNVSLSFSLSSLVDAGQTKKGGFCVRSRQGMLCNRCDSFRSLPAWARLTRAYSGRTPVWGFIPHARAFNVLGSPQAPCVALCIRLSPCVAKDIIFQRLVWLLNMDFLMCVNMKGTTPPLVCGGEKTS